MWSTIINNLYRHYASIHLKAGPTGSLKGFKVPDIVDSFFPHLAQWGVTHSGINLFYL